MDFYDKLKRFLGLPKQQESPNFDDEDRHWHENDSEPAFRNFSIFTEPLEIHRFFEQQMGEMLKNFGFGEFGDGFSHHFNLPQIEPPQEDQTSSRDLRDQFLKPGFQSSTDEDKKDGDIDGRLDMKDWNSVFGGNTETAVTPFQRQVAPKTRFFGQSVTAKTIRNSDGSMETHRTVRDNEGNEETTITRKIGDKEYSVTKRRDKDGKEETIENLVNLEEKEVDSFFPRQGNVPELDRQPWPFFDRFFK